MSTLHTAKCGCGFFTIVKAGGTRANFLTECYFPHYCKECGIVDVNTASKHITCPKCNSQNVVAYGRDDLAKMVNREIIPSIQSFDYRAYRYGNFCPKCKEFTLEFEPPSILFD
jgi:hypothetical protein